jgi:hypothetical protein
MTNFSAEKEERAAEVARKNTANVATKLSIRNYITSFAHWKQPKGPS